MENPFDLPNNLDIAEERRKIQRAITQKRKVQNKKKSNVNKFGKDNMKIGQDASMKFEIFTRKN